jgi:hypothetical protein
MILDEIKLWCERVWYCHHNARVIADFEHRMAIVLCEATGDLLSKPYYTAEAMALSIRDHHQRLLSLSVQSSARDMRRATAQAQSAPAQNTTAQIHRAKLSKMFLVVSNPEASPVNTTATINKVAGKP